MHPNVNPRDAEAEALFVRKAVLTADRSGHLRDDMTGRAYADEIFAKASARSGTAPHVASIADVPFIKADIRSGKDAVLKMLGFSVLGLRHWYQTVKGLPPGPAAIAAHGVAETIRQNR